MEAALQLAGFVEQESDNDSLPDSLDGGQSFSSTKFQETNHCLSLLQFSERSAFTLEGATRSRESHLQLENSSDSTNKGLKRGKEATEISAACPDTDETDVSDVTVLKRRKMDPKEQGSTPRK
jgi:hypothetical protein